MAKKKVNIKKNVEKKNIETKDGSKEGKNFLLITVIVLILFALFYLLTVIILDDDTSSSKGDEDVVEIQHDEVLVGTSFSINDSEYYVLYYETADEDVSSEMASLVSSYRASNPEIYLYTVDMSNALNSAFNSDSGNSLATKAADLKIAGPTLIKFSNNQIDRYVEGIENIEAILK
ncbi:MAG: hypothetical protein PUC82_05000 [bacterium]|nr:hypothetical protein [bacterium]